VAKNVAVDQRTDILRECKVIVGEAIVVHLPALDEIGQALLQPVHIRVGSQPVSSTMVDYHLGGRLRKIVGWWSAGLVTNPIQDRSVIEMLEVLVTLQLCVVVDLLGRGSLGGVGRHNGG